MSGCYHLFVQVSSTPSSSTELLIHNVVTLFVLCFSCHSVCIKQLNLEQESFLHGFWTIMSSFHFCFALNWLLWFIVDTHKFKFVWMTIMFCNLCNFIFWILFYCTWLPIAWFFLLYVFSTWQRKCWCEVANVWTFQIIRRANELGEDPLSLSNRFCQEYLNDMGDLQCLVPTHQPRVSEHLEQIKDMITQVSASVCFTFYFILKSRFLFSLILFFSHLLSFGPGNWKPYSSLRLFFSVFNSKIIENWVWQW